MRRTDEDRFRTPYSTDAAAAAEYARALEISVPGVRQLGSEILGDFDPGILGVRWWAAHLPMAPRILIGDHLYLCVNSIETNLVEARIHLLEALGAAEEQEKRFALAVMVDAAGTLRFKQPKATSPADDLIRARVNLHIVGCVRAIASALDCLGGAIIGVLAFPAQLFRASYKGARTFAERAQTGEQEIQHTYGRRFLDLVDSAGPKGWDEWVLEFRNMLVHRGRRTWGMKIVPAGTGLHIPGGVVVVPSRVVPMLPSLKFRSQDRNFPQLSRSFT